MEGGEQNHFDEFASYSSAELIANGLESELAKRLDSAKGLNASMAEKLCESGYGDEVVEHWQKFGTDADTMLRILADNRAGESALKHLDSFNGADLKSFADHLIEAGSFEAEKVVEHLEDLSIDRRAVLESLFSHGYLTVIAGAVEKFPDLDQVDLKERLLKLGYKGALALAANMDKFAKLEPKTVANELISARHGAQLSAHIEKFQGVNHDAIAIKIIEAGNGAGIIEHPKAFAFKDADAVMRLVIEKVDPVDIELFLPKIDQMKGLSASLRDEIIVKFGKK